MLNLTGLTSDGKPELTGKPDSSHLAGNYAVFLVTVLFKRKEEPAARSLVWLRADHIIA